MFPHSIVKLSKKLLSLKCFSSPLKRSKLWLTAGKKNYPGKLNSEKNIIILAFFTKKPTFMLIPRLLAQKCYVDLMAFPIHYFLLFRNTLSEMTCSVCRESKMQIHFFANRSHIVRKYLLEENYHCNT